MSNKIIVKNLINSEYAVAPEDGENLYKKLKQLIEDNCIPITIDFEGITRTTTAFFNSSLAIFLKDFSSDKLNEYFRFTNLSNTSLLMLKKSIEVAKYRFKEDSDVNKVIKEELKGE